MGAAPPDEALRSEATARFVERSLAEAERRWFSPIACLLVTATAVMLAWLELPNAPGVFRALLALTCVGWGIATVALRVHAAARLAGPAASAANVLASVTSVFAIYAAGTTNTALWLLPFARTFLGLPKRSSASAASRWATVAALIVLGGWQIAGAKIAGAVIVGALLGGYLIMHDVNSRLVLARVRLDAEAEAMHIEVERHALRKENDRIARELHDGIGAELLALMLSLRGKGPVVELHTQRVLGLLEELRSLVWELRGGRGTLSEFEKLIRARARMTLTNANIQGAIASSERTTAVQPHAAMLILGAVHEVLGRAVALTAVTELSVALEASPTIAVTLRFPGLEPALIDRVVGAVDPAELSAAAVDGPGVRIAIR